MVNTDPNHIHSYDEKGELTCCSLEVKVYDQIEHHHHDEHGEHEHHHHQHGSKLLQYIPILISTIFLAFGLLLDSLIDAAPSWQAYRFWIYVLAYLPVAYPVLKDAVSSLRESVFFSEFMLMGLASIGAFCIHQYPEAATVMLFYSIGEILQTNAIEKSVKDIKALMDLRPLTVCVLRNGFSKIIAPEQVLINEIIQLKAGERLALDGILTSEYATFDTLALTGESIPQSKHKGEIVLAGMLNLHTVSEIKVTTDYKDSKLSGILNMTQDALKHKSKSQLFIARFAAIYTPVVVLLSITIVLAPFFFLSDYVFKDWLYRALVFLVVSCPCALVISIPLAYLGGIGLASRNGILFKGGNYLDTIAQIDTIVLDKTGTLTKANFEVVDVKTHSYDKQKMIQLVAALESRSKHPIAEAIYRYANIESRDFQIENVVEFPGLGLKGNVNKHKILLGKPALLQNFYISIEEQVIHETNFTIVYIAIDDVYAGTISIADELKDDAKKSIELLQEMDITCIILSGDKQSVVAEVAKTLHIQKAYGELLPEQKLAKLMALKKELHSVAFVGDGLNDAPVIAMADVGIAMGGLGSDATIETANIVIQNDQPSKVALAIKIGRATKYLVRQNIAIAFAIKILVLILGAWGIATLWEAVFADVGVALLAIFNALRFQNKEFV